MRFTANPKNSPTNPLSPQIQNTIQIPCKETTQDLGTEVLRLQIEGMRCTSCSASIENALKKQEGIHSANVYILNHSAVIHFYPNECNEEKIIEQIESLGFRATIKTANFATSTTFTITKQESVQKTERAGKQDLQTAQTKQTTGANHIKQTKKMQKSPLLRLNDFIESRLLNDKRRLIFSIVLSIIIIYLSMLHDMFHTPLPQWLNNPISNGIAQLFITLCIMHFGRTMYFHGIKALARLRPNMDSLVSIGSLAGFFYSCFALVQGILGAKFHVYFESVCVILSFIMLGKYIEENAKSKAINHAKALLDTKSPIALKITNEVALKENSKETLQIKEVASESLAINDYIQILPHSFVPIDSILYSQHANIDESMLSGESISVRKEKNQRLYAGTQNLDMPIIARVTHTLKDSKISKMQSLLAQTLESKANIAKLTDKVSLFFVPLVILLAACSGIFWLIHSDLQTAMIYFASTLLISCPCALGLATPMAILFANARANMFGIFFKNAQSLENLTKTDYILFDKTGTLTQRIFNISSINVTKDSSRSDKELLQIAASIERFSNHIIATAICEAAKDMEPYKQLDSKHFINAGIESTLLIDSREHTFLIGNERLLKERANLMVEDKSVGGMVCIYLAEICGDNAILLGHILLEESLKPSAKEMIRELQNMGFSCEILSGDTESNVGHVADILQIPYHAKCMPEDKMRYIESLQNKGHKVIMVGDGINDVVAIAKADIAFVMASGSEVSIENGHVIYFREDLMGIVQAISLGRATLRNIKQNLVFATIYNILCIPIAMGVLSPFGIALNPMIASLAMSLSSLSVVGNASRLYGFARQ